MIDGLEISDLYIPGGALAAGVGVLLLFVILRRFLFICRPSEVLIFSGRTQRREDGSDVGFRVVFGGRTWRVPLLESVEKMDMRGAPIDVQVQGAYTKGGIPLKVRAIAVVKLSSKPDIVMNAVERFLGRQVGEIQQVAKETLEANLRGVLATLTPEEVNEDRLKFADSLAQEVEQDLSKLGLHLDVLKIQHVTDDVNYLNSIGRERIANVIRDAEIAESNAHNEASKEAAAAEMRAKVAEADAETAIVKKKNEVRRIAAELEAQAKSLEEQAEAGALAAQAIAEQALQAVRRELESLRLQADVVVPAEVQREAAAMRAAGDAAPIAENGRATAESLRLATAAWTKAGPAAEDMFLLSRIEQLVGRVVKQVSQIQIGPVQLVDSGDGQALPRFAAAYPTAVAAVLRALVDTTGVDVTALLARAGAGAGNGVERQGGSVVNLVAALLGIGVVFALTLAVMLRRLLYICPPNEVLIFSGGQRASSGRRVGYRLIKGGRALRIPLFEIVDRMDLTNMPIEVAVSGAYSKGGIPLNVHGIANVKIAGEQPVLDNAVERFLGVDRDRIMAVAKETLEGNLRGVLATLTPEEVNEDTIKFAQSLLTEAEDDLRRLGLELDTLKIQDVSDDVGYLDSIGRRQSAEVQRKALVAEARSRAQAAIQSAQNRRDTEISRMEAELTTLRAENGRRMADAQTRGLAMVAESEGLVKSRLARAEADVGVQRARVEQVRRQLAADVLEPARAARAAAEANAAGQASQIVEQGRANARAMEEIAATWQNAGPNARQVFLMQKVSDLTALVVGGMSNLKVDRLTVLGGIGGGVTVGSDSAAAGNLTGRLIAASEQIKAATGIDLLASVRGRADGAAPPPVAPVPPAVRK